MEQGTRVVRGGEWWFAGWMGWWRGLGAEVGGRRVCGGVGDGWVEIG